MKFPIYDNDIATLFSIFRVCVYLQVRVVINIVKRIMYVLLIGGHFLWALNSRFTLAKRGYLYSLFNIYDRGHA